MFSQDTSRRDFLLIVCASVSWGTVGIANQTLYTSGVTNALSLSFLRLAIATPLFFLACWMRLGRILFQVGIRSVSATVASIVTMCEPLTAAILAWMLFHEEFGPFGLPGAGLLLGAMALILLAPGKPFAKGT